MINILTPTRWFKVIGVLFFFLLGGVCLASFFGTPIISPLAIFKNSDAMLSDLFWNARLPRIFLCVLTGLSLASSGVAFQSLLRNPLADPYILGVSGGAALGGVIGMSLHVGFHMGSIFAFLFAIASLFLIFRLSLVDGRLPATSLLLTGVMFNAFSFALILLINSIVSMGEAHQILYLLMGSLEAHSWAELRWVAFLILGGFFILLLQASHMNIVSLGEETATQLGLPVEKHRKIIFFAASAMVGVTVALTGLIGFVGLFVPHLMRLILGNDYRLLLPASALGGALFLVLCDFVSRFLFSLEAFQTQLPIGVITALIGGPFFVYLMKKS